MRHVVTLHVVTLHVVTLHVVTLHVVTLHVVTLHVVTLNIIGNRETGRIAYRVLRKDLWIRNTQYVIRRLSLLFPITSIVLMSL